MTEFFFPFCQNSLLLGANPSFRRDSETHSLVPYPHSLMPFHLRCSRRSICVQILILRARAHTHTHLFIYLFIYFLFIYLFFIFIFIYLFIFYLFDFYINYHTLKISYKRARARARARITHNYIGIFYIKIFIY